MAFGFRQLALDPGSYRCVHVNIYRYIHRHIYIHMYIYIYLCTYISICMLRHACAILQLTIPARRGCRL